ncbi:beta-N-acetylhexosaminidase [Parvularcula dongshanensis]|uniref:beta-N-acetylhexosaminidase n=1 Tax=Parvularcula dongshanensis TaxID=1173995 RepID=A0A840I0E1_9PROT|nr:beta-N-acetylhexosaminidase [Parvularcula dongshanensis]MBB4657714.1 beta-N-acetylhexosaminidase [Parvularcula dongshanensis]
MATAAIYGCAGETLSSDEAAFFRDADPWGFILFARNCGGTKQIVRLCHQLRETVARNAPILIDQEGGRVARLKPPLAPRRPPMDRFGELAKLDPEKAKEAAFLGAKLLAEDCRNLGIDVNCVPVLDVPQPGAHDIIGDRALSTRAEMIGTLGRQVVDGSLAGGCLPVIKHLPGHGRALADSHLELPRVTDDREELEEVDFAPFRALADAPLGMTAHIVFDALDPDRPATLSGTVIRDVIREGFGFDGLLMTDDLSMKALTGRFRDRAEASLNAGCDVVLHCNGEMAEMTDVAEGAKALEGEAARRGDAALALIPRDRPDFDRDGAEARFSELLRPVITV